MHFGEPRRHPFSGVAQQGCTNLGRCDIGCPRNARNTIDITYVARAEAHGAEVYPLHEVLDIHPPAHDGGDWRVLYRDLQQRIEDESGRACSDLRGRRRAPARRRHLSERTDALRFVKASPAYMSMMNGQDTMMIELIELIELAGSATVGDARRISARRRRSA